MTRSRFSEGLKFAPQLMSAEFQPSIGMTAKFFNDLGLGLRNFRTPMSAAIKTVMIPSIEQNFISGGRPDAWEPLAPYTIEQRQKKGYGDGPTLIRSKKLMKAATSFTIWSIDAHTAEIKSLPSRVSYGAVHQGGSGFTMAALVKKHKGDKKAAFLDLIANQQLAMRTGATLDRMGGHVPARPFLMIQDEDIIKIRLVFDAWMDVQIAKANARNR